MKVVPAAILAVWCIAGVASAEDAIPQSLTGVPGDSGRGRAIVATRQIGLCLLCHNGPFPEEPSAVGPSLLNRSSCHFTPAAVKGGNLPSGGSTMSEVRRVGTTLVPRSNQNWL